ncbi:MAG: hypothetical protein HRU09_20475 [Oligoflexales bacterium]|nr:hypothetical protein [Oligoflexales bacterium]
MRVFLNLMLTFFCSLSLSSFSFASSVDEFDFAGIYAGGKLPSKKEVCQFLKSANGILYVSPDMEAGSVDSDSDSSFEGNEMLMDIQKIQIYNDPFGRDIKPLGRLESKQGGRKTIESYDASTGNLMITDKNWGFSAPHAVKLVEYQGEDVLMFKIVEDSEEIYGYFLID